MARQSTFVCTKNVKLNCEFDEHGNPIGDVFAVEPGGTITYTHLVKNSTPVGREVLIEDELPLNAVSGTITEITYDNGATGDLIVGSELPLAGALVLPPGGSVRFTTELVVKGEGDLDGCYPYPVTNCQKVTTTSTYDTTAGEYVEVDCGEVCAAIAAPMYISLDGTVDAESLHFPAHGSGTMRRRDVDGAQMDIAFMGICDPCDVNLIMDFLDSGNNLATLIRGMVIVGPDTSGSHVQLTDAFGAELGWIDVTPEP